MGLYVFIHQKFEDMPKEKMKSLFTLDEWNELCYHMTMIESVIDDKAFQDELLKEAELQLGKKDDNRH